MAKIKKTDINKLSKLDQQIEELKKQKKKQEEELARNIGNYVMSNIDFDELESADELYIIIDEVLEKFNKNTNISNDIVNENNTMNSSQSEEFEQQE
ncbi:hypothetical protein DWB98_13235 (plasmid) [Staphylococcus xylosus]|uniref:hypothetical protein n=1 Tax=Staphylococcus xylosus TaxID=1288 RepID=UPI00118BC3D7|nr:hypothetical protein [Staphylococcus xylosus]QDW90405.1 hypothetical protein DWB98_13235 [Staphylococcus xylosus]